MGADLIRHAFRGQAVRFITDEHGEPWFVAKDVTTILGIANGRDALGRVDPDGVGTTDVIDSMGRTQQASTVNEGGLYELIFMSRRPEAREFRRWVTTEVLPSIRRTGVYSATPAVDISTPAGVVAMAEQFLATARALVESQERVAYLEPRAQVADDLLDASGDVSVGDAANVLTRAAVPVGERRLFEVLADLGWLYRGGDSRWHVKQAAIETGRMSALPQTHYHPRTGDVVVDAPQPRVTPKGIAYLLRHLTQRHLVAVG